jgi:hypothetical protein
MSDKKTETCAHPSCNCIAAPDSKYCSTLCEGNEGTVDVVCSCGHPTCVTVARAGSGQYYGD